VLTITWDDVGYYDAHTNLLDAFQLQLISLGNGNFDIVFRYENINWTTGDVSGGLPARPGYSAGDGDPSHYFELSGSGDQSSMLALPSTTGNTGIQGVYVFQVESGNVTSAPVANGAIQFSDSDAAEINTASFVPLNGGAGYLGTFSLDPVSETSGTGSVAWHFALASNEVQQFFSPSTGSPVTQAYDVTIAGDHSSSTTERVSLTVGTTADDVFDFNPGVGQDVVFEFSNQSGAADKIELSDFGFTDFSQLQLVSINNGNDTLISNLGVGVNVANLHASDFTFTNDSPGDPAVVPGTSDVLGDITFAAPNPADSLTATFAPERSDYIGTFTLGALTKSNGAASLGFEFDLGNDQINLGPGQTLTQSYGIAVTDAQNPAMNVSRTVSVSIGGLGNDNFVFHPGIGLDTIVNFDPQHDTIELDHFTNIQSMQQLESLITADAHGDAVIALGHHDSITVAGVTAAQLQQLAQTGHVIMH
jgi:Nidogen-like